MKEKLQNMTIQEKIDEFTSNVYPGQTLSHREHYYYKDAIQEMGLVYKTRINKHNVILWDFVE